MDRAKKRQAELAKPPGSLGKLEEMSIRLAGITGRVCHQIEACRILVFAADNGVIAEGVSSSPESVTLSQAVNMTRHITGMSALAKYFGDSVVVADVGINADVSCPSVLNRKFGIPPEIWPKSRLLPARRCWTLWPWAWSWQAGPGRRRPGHRRWRNGHRQHHNFLGGPGRTHRRSCGTGDGPGRRADGSGLRHKKTRDPRGVTSASAKSRRSTGRFA